MKIYTGDTGVIEKSKKILELGLGIMISSSPVSSPHKICKETFCALDNGAFACFKKGYPFQSDIFLDTIRKAYKLNIALDFIVCPDIVAGGKNSLKFSLDWSKKLVGTPNLALVLQDGMTPDDLDSYILAKFSYLFIGGSVKWKWDNAEMWVKFARKNNKKIHIGQCGQLQYLERAKELDVDSVDSTSFTVNDSFDIIEDFNQQLKLAI